MCQSCRDITFHFYSRNLRENKFVYRRVIASYRLAQAAWLCTSLPVVPTTFRIQEPYALVKLHSYWADRSYNHTQTRALHSLVNENLPLTTGPL